MEHYVPGTVLCFTHTISFYTGNNLVEQVLLLLPFSRPAVPNFSGTRDQFCGRQFFHGPGEEDGLGMIQGCYIYCAFYFYYYYISSTSDHQALGPGSWGPLCFFIYVDMILINPRWIQFAGGVRFLY